LIKRDDGKSFGAEDIGRSGWRLGNIKLVFYKITERKDQVFSVFFETIFSSNPKNRDSNTKMTPAFRALRYVLYFTGLAMGVKIFIRRRKTTKRVKHRVSSPAKM
jgi:hypothetical protein